MTEDDMIKGKYEKDADRVRGNREDDRGGVKTDKEKGGWRGRKRRSLRLISPPKSSCII